MSGMRTRLTFTKLEMTRSVRVSLQGECNYLSIDRWTGETYYVGRVELRHCL
jgi:hypothetical protein